MSDAGRSHPVFTGRMPSMQLGCTPPQFAEHAVLSPERLDKRWKKQKIMLVLMDWLKCRLKIIWVCILEPLGWSRYGEEIGRLLINRRVVNHDRHRHKSYNGYKES